MKCVKCGMILNAKMVRADGALQCQNCGAVYRKKNPSGSTFMENNAYPSQQPAQRVHPQGESRYPLSAASKGYGTGETKMVKKRRVKALKSGHSHSKRPKAVSPILIVFIVLLGIVFGSFMIIRNDYRKAAGITNSVFESKDSKEIKNLLKRLEKAYNGHDVYALLELYDPTYTEATFGLLNLFGLNGSALKSLMPFMSQVIAQSSADTDTGTIKVTLLSYDVDDMDGKARYRVDFSFKDGLKDSLTETTDIVKVDGKWYFAYFQSNIATASASSDVLQSTPKPTSKPTSESIPVIAGLTEEDVQGDLYYFKGKTADGQDGWGVMNAQGKEIIAPFFRSIKDFDGNCFAVSKDGCKWGFIDRHGKLVCDYQFYTNIMGGIRGPDSSGYYTVYDKDSNKYGLYNPVSKKSIPCQYQEVGNVNENGLFPVKQDDYWGVVDVEGKTHVDFRYNDMNKDIKCDRVGISVNGAWGAVDVEGNTIVAPDEDCYRVFIDDNGFIFLTKQNEHGKLFDRHGNYMLPCDAYRHFANGGFVVNEYDWWNSTRHSWLVDSDGNTLIDSDEILSQLQSQEGLEFEACALNPFSDDCILVQLHALSSSPSTLHSEYFYVIDSAGNTVIPELLERNFDNNFYSHDFPIVNDITVINSQKLLIAKRNLWYSDEPRTTRVYSLITGQCVEEYPYLLDVKAVYGDYFVVDKLDPVNLTGSNVLQTLDGSFEQEFKTVNCYNSYAIFSDGVYYGIFTDQGFVGKGVVYSKVSYNADTRIFTLNDGAKQELYRFNPDGTITQLS